MNLFNDFNQLFIKLEKRSAYDPTRIQWLFDNSPDVRLIIGSLYFWHREFQERLLSRRFHQNVPDWFAEKFKSYTTKYKPRVDQICERIELDHFLGDGPSLKKVCQLRLEKSTIKTGVFFSPKAEAVHFVIQWLWNSYNGFADAGISEQLEEGMHSWEWFTDVVGIDLDGIEERWSTLSRVLLPTQISGHLGKGDDNLVELLDDATKAYVLGLPAASVVMCRAICERVLKDFYLSGDDNNGTLKDIIILAEKQYFNVKKMNLMKHVRLANKVMHDYQCGQLDDNEGESVRRFLETVKGLIEQIPEPTSC
jgi:hypothetical protein